MSSHHIIREDQEPALVIDTADAANFELVQQLLEWSPAVMVTQPALEQVLLWGIKIDAAVVEAKHVEEVKELLRDQLPVKIISCGSEAAALETALYFLAASKQTAVNIISDTLLDAVEIFQGLELAVIQNGKRWVFVPDGKFEKWLPAGTHITLYPEAGQPEAVTDHDGLFTLHRTHGFWVCEIN